MPVTQTSPTSQEARASRPSPHLPQHRAPKPRKQLPWLKVVGALVVLLVAVTYAVQATHNAVQKAHPTLALVTPDGRVLATIPGRPLVTAAGATSTTVVISPPVLHAPTAQAGEAIDESPCPIKQPPGLTDPKAIADILIKTRVRGLATRNRDCFNKTWSQDTSASGSPAAQDLARRAFMTEASVTSVINNPPVAYDGETFSFIMVAAGSHYQFAAQIVKATDGGWRFVYLAA